jgi:hypothetical protein
MIVDDSAQHLALVKWTGVHQLFACNRHLWPRALVRPGRVRLVEIGFQHRSQMGHTADQEMIQTLSPTVRTQRSAPDRELE